MSDSLENERERIREQKRQEVLEKYGEGAPPADEAGGSRAAEGPSTPTGTDGEYDSPVEVRDKDHLDRLVGEHRVVLVDCHADWCGPCQMMEPAIRAVAADSPAVVAKVDVDAHQLLARQLGVRGVPTLALFVDGEPVERLVGAQDRATLDALVERHAG